MAKPMIILFNNWWERTGVEVAKHTILDTSFPDKKFPARIAGILPKNVHLVCRPSKVLTPDLNKFEFVPGNQKMISNVPDKYMKFGLVKPLCKNIYTSTWLKIRKKTFQTKLIK